MGNQESIQNLKDQLKIMTEEVVVLNRRSRHLTSLAENDFIPKNPKARFEETAEYVATIKDLSILSLKTSILQKEEVITNLSSSLKGYEDSLEVKKETLKTSEKPEVTEAPKIKKDGN